MLLLWLNFKAREEHLNIYLKGRNFLVQIFRKTCDFWPEISKWSSTQNIETVSITKICSYFFPNFECVALTVNELYSQDYKRKIKS